MGLYRGNDCQALATGRLVEAAVCTNTLRNLDGNTTVCCVLWVERPGQRQQAQQWLVRHQGVVVDASSLVSGVAATAGASNPYVPSRDTSRGVRDKNG